MKRTMTINELKNMKNDLRELPLYVVEDSYTEDGVYEKKVYAYSHTSMASGYVRKNALYTPHSYKGNFGTGFTVLSNNTGSTRYCYKSYYIEITHRTVCENFTNCTLCPLYEINADGENCLY